MCETAPVGKAKRGRARVLSERAIGVQEASAVAVLAEGVFLVVDDEKGAFRCDDEGATPLETARGLADLEGICLSSDGARAYILAERDGSIWRAAVGGEQLAPAERLGALPRLNKHKNQGWEGITYLDEGFFDPTPELVAVHQTNPRRVGFFTADTLEPRALLRLPKRARKCLGDLNDVTVLPGSRHIVVVSGKKGMLGELACVEGQLQLVREYPLSSSKHDVPEGDAAAGDRRLWVVTDGEGLLRSVQLDA